MTLAPDTPLISRTAAVTLIGGGEVTAADLACALEYAPHLIAVDGGGDAALALGAVPELVIGDLDSLSARGRARIPDVLHITEQDSTDFDKALRSVSAPLVIAVGFAGRRPDHTLAALNVLVRRRTVPTLMLAGEDVVFAAPPQLALDVAAGCRVSLFPMGRVTGTSTGLRWPIDGIEMSPDGRVGTSNEATGPVTLAIDGPMLVLLPRSEISRAISAICP